MCVGKLDSSLAAATAVDGITGAIENGSDWSVGGISAGVVAVVAKSVVLHDHVFVAVTANAATAAAAGTASAAGALGH